MFVGNNVLVTNTALIGDIYQNYKSTCGFVFFTIARESVFGMDFY